MSKSKNLQEFLRKDILPKIVTDGNKPNKEIIEKLTSTKLMKDWDIVFTHESVNLERGHNYEEYELVGDQSAGLCFIKMLYREYPTLDRGILSNLKSYYMSKHYQPELSDQLGLPKYVKLGRNLTINKSIKEDIFEAFFGGLEIIGDKVAHGLGNDLSYRLMSYLFKDVEMDTDVKSTVSVVKEIFNRMGWGNKPIITSTKGENGTEITISMSSEALNSLKKLHDDPNFTMSTILAIETAPTKAEAVQKAHVVALDKLRELGLTEDFIEEYKSYQDSTNPVLSDEYEKAMEKWEKQGYEKATILVKDTRSKLKFVNLIGIKKNGVRSLLESAFADTKDNTQAKLDVLKKYNIEK